MASKWLFTNRTPACMIPIEPKADILLKGQDMQDKLNCVKNMIWMMCCDGEIAEREKKFLKCAAKEIALEVNNWNSLVKEVLADGGKLYQIEDQDKAIVTLKSLLVMAKADRKMDPREKEYLLRFAKSINITNSQWEQVRKGIAMEGLFDPFKETQSAAKPAGAVIALKDNFDRIDEFAEVARDNNVTTRIVGFDEFIAGAGDREDIVCFHAAENKDESIRRCKELLDKSGDKIVSILTRYQGHQVKYLHEQGLKKCIIEPVYSQDIDKLFQ